MKCLCCGAAELARETRNLTYTYKGQATVIEDVVADYCPACGEAVLDRLNGNRYGAMTAAFRRQINGALVDPSFIADVRRKLDLEHGVRPGNRDGAA